MRLVFVEKTRVKSLFILFLILTCFHPSNAQTYTHPTSSDQGFLGESERFRFYSHFWLNMHHFLYNKALVYGKSQAEGSLTLEEWNSFDKYDRKTISAVLKFYSERITKEDLRTGDHNFNFKRWIIKYGQDDSPPMSNGFKDHLEQLIRFRPVYKKYFWESHNAANKKILNENIDLGRKYEGRFVKRLTELCKAEWQAEKIRVDISYNSKRDIPYTTTFPTTHIIMDSSKSGSIKGEWFELLFHESSHHLIGYSTGFVGGTILDVAEILNRKASPDLWHAYLFYFTGKIAKELLAEEGMSDYELYMIRLKVFSSLHQRLDKHLSLYMSKKIELAEATRRIFDDTNSVMNSK